MRVAGEAIELRDHQRRACQLAVGQRRRELRPIIALAGLDLDEFGDELPLAAVEVVLRTALRCASRPRPDLPCCWVETRRYETKLPRAMTLSLLSPPVDNTVIRHARGKSKAERAEILGGLLRDPEAACNSLGA